MLSTGRRANSHTYTSLVKFEKFTAFDELDFILLNGEYLITKFVMIMVMIWVNSGKKVNISLSDSNISCNKIGFYLKLIRTKLSTRGIMVSYTYTILESFIILQY